MKNMRHSREIKWLKNQLPTWIANDLITEDQADQIRSYYDQKEGGRSRNLALVIGGFLGALLVGGGIILIFAYNWDDLSRLQRTILSFLPLIIAQGIYGYTFFRKPHSRPWIEGSSIFLMLMLASSMALISQTYHIAGSTADFLLIWVVLSIPLLYLQNASITTILYLVIATSWVIQNDGDIDVAFWGLLAVATPHLYWNYRQHPGSCAIISWPGLLQER
jgi:uncharacterized membrane protein